MSKSDGWSLSARRAWIEISTVIVILRKRNTVALRKESVDRNYSFGLFGVDTVSSLSARRAWIEIWLLGLLRAFVSVALRKESVDRNIRI